MTRVNADRNLAMVERYAAGITLAEIGAQFGVSRERVRQILAGQGAVTSEDARRVRREARANALATEVERFLAEFRPVLESMASRGVPRTEVEARFALLAPEVPALVVRESVDEAGILFNVDVQEFTFSDAVIECAVWYALSREAELVPALAADAIPEIDLKSAREIANALQGAGLDAVSSHIFC